MGTSGDVGKRMEDGQMLDLMITVIERLDRLLERIESPKRFLSVSSAARYCDLSEDSIRRIIERGDLTALRPVRGRVLIDRVELDAYMLSSTRQPRNGRGRRRP